MRQRIYSLDTYLILALLKPYEIKNLILRVRDFTIPTTLVFKQFGCRTVDIDLKCHG